MGAIGDFLETGARHEIGTGLDGGGRRRAVLIATTKSVGTVMVGRTSEKSVSRRAAQVDR